MERLLLKVEFEKQELNMRPDSVRSLTLKVIEAKLDVSGLRFAGIAKCKVAIRIRIGNGYVTDAVNESNVISSPASCDLATSQVILNLLNDAEIVNYLSQ